MEHGVTGGLRIYINWADEATIHGFVNFAPYVDPRIVDPTQVYATGGTANYNNPNNRAIGLFQGAEVWVRPWIYAGYVLALDTGAGGRDKSLAMRTRSGGMTGLGAFGPIAEHEHYPIRARQLAREFGVGLFQRHKAAILYTGGLTYVAPSSY